MRDLEAYLKKTYTPIVNRDIKRFHGLDKNTVLYKYDTPLSVEQESLTIKHSRDFSLFSLYNIASLGIIFSYLFVSDNKLITIEDEYFYVKRPSARKIESFTSVELAYQSPYLNVYESQDGCVLVSQNNLFNVIEKSMVRKSQKDVQDE
jgi:hypothetical protein